jgi:integrase/recombinase XerD
MQHLKKWHSTTLSSILLQITLCDLRISQILTFRITEAAPVFTGKSSTQKRRCNTIDDSVALFWRFYMAAFGEWIGWQVYDQNGRRKYLSADERIRFLAVADRLAPAQRALCYVLAYGGCRISEALALTVHHLDIERLALTIRTLKRRRTVFRVVPVPEAVVAILRSVPVGTEGRLLPIHRATAWRLVKAVMARAGVSGPMASPKGLRHGFGICAAGHNVPTNLIQRWMGHASPVTTAIYLDAVGVEERRFASRMW